MSRTSVALRFRNATITPSDVSAAEVEQHSHTRGFTTISRTCLPEASYTDARKLMSPDSVSGLVARPSIHTNPSPAPGAWKRDTNPCSVLVPSWCGVSGRDHVCPWSLDHDSITLEASESSSAPSLSSQCATKLPS